MHDKYFNNYNGTSTDTNILGTTITTTDGLWSQITDSTNPWTDPTLERIKEFENQLEIIKLDNKLLRLKMLSMEGKFTAEEVTNIRKMLMSNDEASKTLADSIIENA